MCMKTVSAEVFGTALLVFVGYGSAILGGHAGLLPVALAFGFAIVAAAYSIGSVSGAHLNPAVTLPW